MYIYLDKNGVVKEIVSSVPFRVGNENSNIVYVYFEDLESQIDGVNFYVFKNGASESVLRVGEKIITSIPYDKEHDLKYFKYEKDYAFYYIKLGSDILDTSGLLKINAIATARMQNLVSGLILLNVEDSVVKITSDISISEYQYIKDTLAKLNASEYDKVIAYLGAIPSDKTFEENKVILNVLDNNKIKFYIQKQDGLHDLGSNGGGTSIEVNVPHDFNAPQLSSLKVEDTIYQVPTKDYVNHLISSVVNNAYVVVESLPQVGKSGVMYLVGSEPPYEMFIFEGSSYIDLGSTSIDLTNYYTKEEIDNNFATSESLNDYLLISVAKEDYATKEEIAVLQPKLVSGVNIATINNKSILGANNNFSLVDTLTYESDKSSIANGFVYENSSDKLYLAKDTNKLGTGLEFKTINGVPIVGAGRISTLTFKKVEIEDMLDNITAQGTISEEDYIKLTSENTTILKIITNNEWDEEYLLNHTSTYTDMTATEHLIYSKNIFKMFNNVETEFSLSYEFNKETDGTFKYVRTLKVVMTSEVVNDLIDNKITTAINSEY